MDAGSEPRVQTDGDVPISPQGAAAYRLGARQGRTGDVYQAQHPRLDGRVAIKLYRRATGLGAAVVDAFHRESARATALRHPHIAQVIESGVREDGVPFTAMEYLAGATLEETMAGRSTLLASELLELVKGTASALAAAHGAGIVHRELRPDNIFITKSPGQGQGFVKLLDFGVCHLTAGLMAMGRHPGAKAIRYFAPEQVAGRLSDSGESCDQYALAAIANCVLTGTLPVQSERAAGRGKRQKARARRATGQLALQVPALDAILRKALGRNPEDRFESVALFAHAFEEALMGAASKSSVHGSAETGRVGEDLRPASAPLYVVSDTGREEELPSPPAASAAHSSLSWSLAEKFFEDGDLQEATNFENLPHQPEPNRRSSAHLTFDSFDRVPTQRTSIMIALAVLVSLVGAAAWWVARMPAKPPPAGNESSAPKEAAAAVVAPGVEDQREPKAEPKGEAKREAQKAGLPPAASSSRVTSPKGGVTRLRSAPLMLWSPERQMMMPADEISGTAVSPGAPLESGPPPPQAAPTAASPSDPASP